MSFTNTREDIVSEIFSKLKAMNSPRLGKIVRDPIVAEDLPKTAFPVVYIETTDEDIEDITINTKQLRHGMMDVDIVAIISGTNRDKQRNIIVEGIENALLADRTVNNKATHIALTRVESVEVGQSAPYASVRMVFTVKRHYTIT
jgi:hypothetical protein